MNQRHSTKHRFRKMAYEPLEMRLTMNGDSAEWLNAQSLTLSFVPDGTNVSGQSSALASTMAGAALSHWQETIVQAFQTWGQKANINIGVVQDGGQPLGIQGGSHDDHRFGDIRIAGIPLSLDTYGEAIHESRTMVGTWAGDVIFNTSAPWTNEADLFSVALHEAGHVLGLDHSTDPLSPMFAHGVSQTNGPTAGDISALQALYGPRRPDVHEGPQQNETIGRATRIPHSEPVDGFDGRTPLVVYGDVRNSTDKDVFELPVLPGYQGTLTFDLVTRGISQLSGRLTMLDRHGNVLGQVSTSASLGDKVSFQFTLPSGADTKYYLRIDTPATDIFSSGSYALVTKYDGLLTTPAATIDQIVLDGFRWQARTDDRNADVDTKKLLNSGGVPQLDNDLHQDDSISTSVTLQAKVDTPALKSFQFIGTISDSADVDLYRVRSQSDPSALRGLTVLVESLEHGGLIPTITVFDKTGVVLPVKMLTNGNGQVMLRVSGIVDNQDYFIQVAGKGGTLGNYALNATYDDVALARTSVLTGTLSTAEPFHASTIYVARPQLFSFAMESQADATSSGVAPIWATIYDDNHRTVAFLGSATGEFRTGTAVLLQPGTYYLEIEGRDSAGATNPDASFNLYLDRVSDPVGPPVLAPGTQPIFGYDPTTGLFTFPNLPPTPTPVVIAPPPTTLPPPPTDVISAPVDVWFWSPGFLPTNPVDPLDASGDGFVSPFDALLVINYLNSTGSSADPTGPRLSNYLDTSGDGFISPVDVLLVINRLNSTATTGAGEFTAVAPATANTNSPPQAAIDPTVIDLVFAQSVLDLSARKNTSTRAK